MRELTIDELIEVVKLRVKRRKLLFEEPKTINERRMNQAKRVRVNAKLFQLTRNPIYINF